MKAVSANLLTEQFGPWHHRQINMKIIVKKSFEGKLSTRAHAAALALAMSLVAFEIRYPIYRLWIDDLSYLMSTALSVLTLGLTAYIVATNCRSKQELLTLASCASINFIVAFIYIYSGESLLFNHLHENESIYWNYVSDIYHGAVWNFLFYLGPMIWVSATTISDLNYLLRIRSDIEKTAGCEFKS